MSEKPEHIGLDSKSPAERDRIDMNHEISGESTGRIQRFLSNDSHSIYGDSEKKKSERHYRSMLEILLAEDAQYAALYSQVTDKLEKAYQVVGQVLIDVNQHLEDSYRNLQTLQDNATKLEDGTKVFQSINDGSIYTEEGKRLNDDAAQNINVSDGAPSWEAYQAEREKYEALLRDRQRIKDYKSDTLDDINQRLNDKDDPYTKDELEDLNNDFPAFPDLETTSINMPAENAIGYSSVAKTIDEGDDKPIQNISADFNNANNGILNLTELEAVVPQNTVAPIP